MARLLVVSLSEFDVAVAAAAQPARVGRFRGLYLRNRFAGVLVRRPDSRSGQHARYRAASLAEKLYGYLALGWRDSAIHWHRYQKAYLLLAGLATPLVLSVHTIVSFDFAISILPGWHTTIFPPYFVAGAIYSGFAMVLTLIIPLRSWYNMRDLITLRHIDAAAKFMLGTGLIVAYGYSMEAFFSWYSGDPYESFMYWNRMTGPYGFTYALLITCNIALPQSLWSRRVRHNIVLVWFISNRRQHRHVARTLRHRRNELASRLSAVLLGHLHSHQMGLGDICRHLGFFMFLIFLVRAALPSISIFEVREVVHHEMHGEAA